ncbi:MAG: flagellar basal body protein, partial [Holosporales bacterium]
MSIQAAYIAASGMEAQQRALEVTAHNLANMN